MCSPAKESLGMGRGNAHVSTNHKNFPTSAAAIAAAAAGGGRGASAAAAAAGASAAADGLGQGASISRLPVTRSATPGMARPLCLPEAFILPELQIPRCQNNFSPAPIGTTLSQGLGLESFPSMWSPDSFELPEARSPALDSSDNADAHVVPVSLLRCVAQQSAWQPDGTPCPPANGTPELKSCPMQKACSRLGDSPQFGSFVKETSEVLELLAPKIAHSLLPRYFGGPLVCPVRTTAAEPHQPPPACQSTCEEQRQLLLLLLQQQQERQQQCQQLRPMPARADFDGLPMVCPAPTIGLPTLCSQPSIVTALLPNYKGQGLSSGGTGVDGACRVACRSPQPEGLEDTESCGSTPCLVREGAGRKGEQWGQLECTAGCRLRGEEEEEVQSLPPEAQEFGLLYGTMMASTARKRHHDVTGRHGSLCDGTPERRGKRARSVLPHGSELAVEQLPSSDACSGVCHLSLAHPGPMKQRACGILRSSSRGHPIRSGGQADSMKVTRAKSARKINGQGKSSLHGADFVPKTDLSLFIELDDESAESGSVSVNDDDVEIGSYEHQKKLVGLGEPACPLWAERLQLLWNQQLLGLPR